MPTFYSDVASNQNDFIKTSAERQNDGAAVSGDVLIATAKYTFDATEVDNDIINIVKLPEGATVIPHLCKVFTSLTATVTADIDVGDDDDTTAADDNRYCTTTVIDQASGSAFDFTPGVAGGTPYQLQKQSWIQAKLSGTANLTADDTITFLIAYRAQS